MNCLGESLAEQHEKQEGDMNLWSYTTYSNWEKCPVCEGSGRDETGKKGATVNEIGTCHVCDGKGIISKHSGKPPKDQSQ